ncbi:hypothetical protein HDU84_001660 [Entophlyctis sp. JEL0112]|nr:hypothetical protein HDU84_001660 [Entophlyctis sp. JEL0112]
MSVGYLGRFGAEVYPHSDPSDAWARAINLLEAARGSGDIGRVGILVGRGLPCSHPDGIELIPCDRFGGAFRSKSSDQTSAQPACHLWMDFNIHAALALLPSASATTIIVDWSTWRYMTPLAIANGPVGNGVVGPKILSDWYRILKPGGSLVFEGTISSLRMAPQVSKDVLDWEFDNPTHPTVSQTWMTPVSWPKSEPAVNLQIAWNKRKILSAPKSKKDLEVSIETKKEWQICYQLYPMLDKVWENIFADKTHWRSITIYKNLPFPIETSGYIERWIKVVKTGGK